MPTISVVVPVYKVEECLPVCVDSILSQDYADFELLLVDDGSPDRSGEICEEYAERDSRITVIHQENQGLSGARNTGIDASNGQYITFVDSDDILAENYLSILYEAIVSENADISMCLSYDFEDGTMDALPTFCTNKLEKYKVYDGKTALIRLYGVDPIVQIGAVCKLYRRSVIQDLKFPVGRLHEDQALTPMLFYKAAKIVFTGAEAYYYRVRSGSITHEKFSLRRYDDIWAIDNCIRFFERYNETEIVKAAKIKRQKLICIYSIYARRDGIEIPPEYSIGTAKALRFLYGKVSDIKFEYYLAQVDPKYVRPYEYLVRAKKMLGGRGRKHE